jgi:hypothetical protein
MTIFDDTHVAALERLLGEAMHYGSCFGNQALRWWMLMHQLEEFEG